MVYIYNHLGSYQYVIAKDEREARLLFYARRTRDFYYYKLVGTAPTRKEARKFVLSYKAALKQSQDLTPDLPKELT